MSRTDPQISLRLPRDLKSRVVEAAKKNGRTITAEIVHRLQRSFDEALAPPLPAELAKAIFETREMVSSLRTAATTPQVGTLDMLPKLESKSGGG